MALPALLIPNPKKKGKSVDVSTGRVWSLGLGMLAFLLILIALAWFQSQIPYMLLNTDVEGKYNIDPSLSPSMKEATIELWLRETIPPFIRRTCYARAENVCRLADQLEAMVQTQDKKTSYLKQFMISLAGGALTGIFSWNFQRKRNPEDIISP